MPFIFGPSRTPVPITIDLRCPGHNACLPRGKHILNEYPIPRGGIADEHVGDSADEMPVLDDRGARQECGQ